MLCNGNLTTQLTMTPEKTNYLTNGPDGIKRLAQGPDLPSYRGLSIINSRKFSMDAGTQPRDLLRRRVRVAEYYRIPWEEGIEKKSFEFYDQSRDTYFRLTWDQLYEMSKLHGEYVGHDGADMSDDNDYHGSAHWTYMGGPDSGRKVTLEIGGNSQMFPGSNQALRIAAGFDNSWGAANAPPTATAKGTHYYDLQVADKVVLAWQPSRTGANADSPYVSPQKGGSLTMPSLLTSSATPHAKKMYNVAELTHKLSSTTKNRHVEPLNTIWSHWEFLKEHNKQNKTLQDKDCYTEQSETFGGGIFNDPVLKNKWLPQNFESLDSEGVGDFDETASLALTWFVKKLFDETCASKAELTATKQFIRSGKGYVDSIFAGVHGEPTECMSEMIYYMIFKKGSNVAGSYPANADDGPKAVTWNPVTTAMGLVGIDDYHNKTQAERKNLRDIIMNAWNACNDAERGAKWKEYMLELGINVADDNYQSSAHGDNSGENRKYKLLPLRYDSTNTERGALNVLAQAEETYQTTSIQAHIESIFTRMFPAAAAQPTFTEQTAKDLVISLTKRCVVKYWSCLGTWADSMWLERKYCEYFGKELPHNCQMWRNFDDLDGVLQTDSVRQCLQSEYLLDKDRNCKIVHRNVIKQRTYLVTDWMKFYRDQGTRIWDMFTRETQECHPDALFAANVCGVATHHLVHRPNQHLSRCEPLKSSDMEHSATSVNPTVWLLQQMAGIMPMTKEMCDALLRDHPVVDRKLCLYYKQFLVGNVKANDFLNAAGPAAWDWQARRAGTTRSGPDDEAIVVQINLKGIEYPYNTFLMHLFMSHFHPDSGVREAAAIKAETRPGLLQQLMQSIGNAIANNETHSKQVESDIKTLPATHYDSGSVSGLYCTATMASEYFCVACCACQYQSC